MREIEFRGKRIDTGEWIYGFVRTIWTPKGEEQWYTIQPAHNFESNGWTDSEETRVMPETVDQYTGLKDKNGVKIFEGDVVEWTDRKVNKRMDKVVWDTGGFRLCNSSYTVGAYCNAPNLLKVIGNIHDNPELLEANDE